MVNVKKIDEFTGCFEIIGIERAVAEILFHNHGPDLETEHENKIRKQLEEGYIQNTQTHHYMIINPVKDFIENIDDEIE